MIAIAVDYRVTPVEIVLGLNWMAWGIVLLLFPNTMDGGRVYRIVRELIPEEQLGAVFFLVGAMLVGGALSRVRLVRRAGAFLSSILWIAWGIQAYLSAGTVTVGVGQAIALAGASLWITWRWGMTAGASKRAGVV